jgi:GxxExxY protein
MGTTEGLLHEELTRKIIGAAITVLNELRPGLDEKLYENALLIELRDQGLRADQQSRFPVHFKGQLIGTLVPDLIVENVVIVDTKVVSNFHDEHIAQMLGYLSITELDLALLLNFRSTRLQWKRVLHPRLLS